MKKVVKFSLGVALALCSTAALAFQEQQGGSVKAPATASAAPAGGSENLNLSTPEIAKQTQGTEVRIPGLGKLGVLPKMDFGLELLYGAAETKEAPVTAPREGEPEDLTIRGTVKHRF